MKSKRFAVISVILLALSFFPWITYSFDLTLNNTPAHVYFSPNGGCTNAIIKEIDSATMEILVQGYSFTSAPIAKAIVNAKKRAVSVEVILDKSQNKEKYTSATFMANSRIPTFIDSAHAIAHNKIIIIDKKTVITGSFNFTKAAEEKNAENVLIIKNKDLASLYIDNWLLHKKHTQPYAPRY